MDHIGGNFIRLSTLTKLILQGNNGPQGAKGTYGDFGEDGTILVIVDPETGGNTKEFVVWVNLISEVLNVTQLAEKGEPGPEVLT